MPLVEVVVARRGPHPGHVEVGLSRSQPTREGCPGCRLAPGWWMNAGFRSPGATRIARPACGTAPFRDRAFRMRLNQRARQLREGQRVRGGWRNSPVGRRRSVFGGQRDRASGRRARNASSSAGAELCSQYSRTARNRPIQEEIKASLACSSVTLQEQNSSDRQKTEGPT